MEDKHNGEGFQKASAKSSDASTGHVRLQLSRFDSRQESMDTWMERDVADKTLSTMASAFSTLISNLGEDPEREGLRKTPIRAARALCYFTRGYEETVQGESSYQSHYHQSRSSLGGLIVCAYKIY